MVITNTRIGRQSSPPNRIKADFDRRVRIVRTGFTGKMEIFKAWHRRIDAAELEGRRLSDESQVWTKLSAMRDAAKRMLQELDADCQARPGTKIPRDVRVSLYCVIFNAAYLLDRLKYFGDASMSKHLAAKWSPARLRALLQGKKAQPADAKPAGEKRPIRSYESLFPAKAVAAPRKEENPLARPGPTDSQQIDNLKRDARAEAKMARLKAELLLDEAEESDVDGVERLEEVRDSNGSLSYSGWEIGRD